jgi:methyl-accepting chemotaxis protein
LAEISAASGEQAEGIRQTNSAVSKMDDVVQQNASNAQQASASAEELTNQAEALRRAVRQLALILGSGVRIGLTPGEPRPSPALPNRLQLKDGLEQTDKPKLPVKGENQ